MTRAARIAATLRLLRLATEHGWRRNFLSLFTRVADGSTSPRDASLEVGCLIGREEPDPQLVADLAILVLAP